MKEKEFYSQVIDWKKRLTNEMPFFEKIFQKYGQRHILDCACGPGRHVAALAKQGFCLTGTDISPEMIKLARAHARKSKIKARFSICDFTRLHTLAIPMQDAVLCIGNSFSLAGSLLHISRAFRSIHRVLSPGGLFLFQVLNYQRIFAQKIEWTPVRETMAEGHKCLVLKRFSSQGKEIHVHWINLHKEQSTWRIEEKQGKLLPLSQTWTKNTLKKNGFHHIRFYGNYQMDPLQKSSKDMLVICQKK